MPFIIKVERNVFNHQGIPLNNLTIESVRHTLVTQCCYDDVQYVDGLRNGLAKMGNDWLRFIIDDEPITRKAE